NTMLDAKRLQSFSLLKSLSDHGLTQVAKRFITRSLGSGEVLFNRGDSDPNIYFLLDGTISLRSDDNSPAILIRADSDAAQMPLSRLKPRRYTAVAGSAAKVAVIDEDLLDRLLAADHTAAYEVTVIEGDDPEWMFHIFSNPAFKKVPEDNLMALLSQLQTQDIKAGQTVIRQGDHGDYYYLIRRGRAQVLRSFRGETPAQVAELGPGDGFGEEALLSNDPRNASVIMTEDGVLMRLSITDFNSLLRASLVPRVSPIEVPDMVRAGAGTIDVRTSGEYDEDGLSGSLNLPLCNLRPLAATLPNDRQYITVCQTGRRSSAAAFLLNQRGFDVYALRGNLASLSALKPNR
ncbi:MAG: hypothetical protein COY64_09670, partial [Hydrogenophilales bacterium CG_4_10_14_0_8_um_filter_62_70]